MGGRGPPASLASAPASPAAASPHTCDVLAQSNSFLLEADTSQERKQSQAIGQ